MHHLKEVSLKIEKGMEVFWPTTGIEDKIDLTNIQKRYGKSKVFSIGDHGKTICYTDNGNLYVTPKTRFALARLRSNKYREEHFPYVPFDGVELPRLDYGRWLGIIKWADMTYRDDFTADCLDYSREHGVGRLSHITLKKCFEIPEDGIMVKNYVFEERITPVLDQKKPDRLISSYVGRYSTNSGLVIFIYQDGRTFLAKGRGIVKKLRHAGYKEAGIFVPLSNGSLPINERLRNQWEALPSF